MRNVLVLVTSSSTLVTFGILYYLHAKNQVDLLLRCSVTKVSPVVSMPLLPKPLDTDGKLHWVRMTSGDQLPPDAVIGGFDKGETVYVARAMYNRTLTPGKYVPSLKLAVVGWGLQAHDRENFEILCGYNLSWVKTQCVAIPPNAFPGGLAPETDNQVLYIGRAKVENSLIPGKVHLHYKCCFITYEHLEKENQEYEALVVPDKKDLYFYPTAKEGPLRLINDNWAD